MTISPAIWLTLSANGSGYFSEKKALRGEMATSVFAMSKTNKPFLVFLKRRRISAKALTSRSISWIRSPTEI